MVGGGVRGGKVGGKKNIANLVRNILENSTIGKRNLRGKFWSKQSLKINTKYLETVRQSGPNFIEIIII